MQTATQNEISFRTSNAEFETIQRIADRAVSLDRKFCDHARDRTPRQEFVMDITAVHANGNPLRLDDLLNADDFNFAHDVFGIRRHLNRNNAQLEDFFSPRFSARTKKALAQ